MDESGQLAIVTTTVATSEDAESLARSVVDQCLAACVQIDGPITSHYRWAGKVQQSTEYRLTIKTSGRALSELKKKIAKQHPYDEPEIIVVAVTDCSDGYQSWVNDQTT